jgi:hypothetical protein
LVCEAPSCLYLHPMSYQSGPVSWANQGDTTSHKDVSLVSFNTVEPISLTPESCMQRKGVPILYERAASQVAGAIALCLPSGECPRTGASDSESVLPEWQLSQSYISSLLPGPG